MDFCVCFVSNIGPSLHLIKNECWCVIEQAALWDNAELLEDLLRGDQLGLMDSQDSWGRTPLHAAATTENSRCLRVLLQAGANPNVPCGPRGENRISCAEHSPDQDANSTKHHVAARVQPKPCLLKTVGSPPGHSPNGNVQRGEVKIADLFELYHVAGHTPLHVCAEHGFVGNVMLLLAHNADLLARDSAGLTPLDIAEKGEHAECMQVLKQAAEVVDRLLLNPPAPPRPLKRKSVNHVPSKIEEKQKSGKKLKNKGCRVCSAKGIVIRVVWHCLQCDEQPSLCVPYCFDQYHE
ncbi:hypothetical protein J6590_056310 [Homalodisca vitripennis]|nr:hypothetical protein J6590_056310 [Homalodisca vitripennis]